MLKQATFAAIVAAVTLLSGQAFADTATDTFKVKITILKTCTVNAGAASDIDLGSVISSATNTSASNTIKVTCSKTTPYNIGLRPSNNDTAGAGVMAPTVAAASTDTVPYQLRSVSATGAIWGNTATASNVGNGVAGIGTGQPVSHTVFAVAPSANFTPTSYNDTVQVTINY